LQTDTLPNINQADSSQVVLYKYKNGETGKELRFFKVLNGGHDWPGAWGNQDMNTTKEIWKFFEQYLHR